MIVDTLAAQQMCKPLNLSAFDILRTDPPLKISIAGVLRRDRFLTEGKRNSIDNRD
jgi:hypothetical protein